MKPVTEAGSVFRPALLLMCGRTLAFIATFFIPVVLARVFDPSQFGTYKQIFLIQSTAYFVAQVGMATSLYYFLPQAGASAGRYVANSFSFLTFTGLIAFALLVLGAPLVAGWMSNPALVRYLWWTALYLCLMMMSASLEIVLIARGNFLWASITYAASDIARAAALTIPVILFRNLDSLLAGAAVVAALRVIATLFYFRSAFDGSLVPDRGVLRKQLAYAFPFGAAVLVEVFYASLPGYVVSFLSNPATFAVFAVGCLQIPLVEFAASPTSDVMMVRMQESLAKGRREAVVDIWHDAFWKLALLFFPLVALTLVEARDIILSLFTAKYVGSIPLFRVWSGLILLATLQVDGVLRVFAETRFIFLLNVMRLAIVASLLVPSLAGFQLLGPVIVILLATVAFKVAALRRMTHLLGVGLRHLLPWRRISTLAMAAGIAAVSVIPLKMLPSIRPAAELLAVSVVYSAVYCLLVWRFHLLTEDEERTIGNWLRRKVLRRSEDGSFENGVGGEELCVESQVSSV